MTKKIDAMNLAKQMQILSDKDKDYYMHQLFRLENLRPDYLKGGRYRKEYLLFKSMFVSSLVEKLRKKDPKSDLENKRKLVEDGIRAYMEFSSPDSVIQFFDTFLLIPTIVKKATSKTLSRCRRPVRIYE